MMTTAAPSLKPEAWRPLGAALAAACVTCLVYLTPGLSRALEFDRALVVRGEIWRVATSHWTHWSGEHLFWDLLAFCALLPLALRISRRHTAWLLAAATVAIPTGVLLLQREFVTYRGLSGLDSALWVYVALAWFRRALRSRDRLGAVLVGAVLAGFIGKVTFEFVTGGALFVKSMGPNVAAVPLAHVIGAALAIAMSPGMRTDENNTSGTAVVPKPTGHTRVHGLSPSLRRYPCSMKRYATSATKIATYMKLSSSSSGCFT